MKSLTTIIPLAMTVFPGFALGQTLAPCVHVGGNVLAKPNTDTIWQQPVHFHVVDEDRIVWYVEFNDGTYREPSLVVIANCSERSDLVIYPPTEDSQNPFLETVLSLFERHDPAETEDIVGLMSDTDANWVRNAASNECACDFLAEEIKREKS